MAIFQYRIRATVTRALGNILPQRLCSSLTSASNPIKNERSRMSAILVMEMSQLYSALLDLQRAQVRALLCSLGSHVTLSTSRGGRRSKRKLKKPVTTFLRILLLTAALLFFSEAQRYNSKAWFLTGSCQTKQSGTSKADELRLLTDVIEIPVTEDLHGNKDNNKAQRCKVFVY